jgi:hypothetical protein
MSYEVGRKAFADADFYLEKETKKLILYRGPGIASDIYLKKTTKNIEIVVHPDARDRARRAAVGRGSVKEDPFHNSNMTTFPLIQHKGKDLIRYGFAVVFETQRELEEFLRVFDQNL